VSKWIFAGWAWTSPEMLPVYVIVGAFLVLGAVAWARDWMQRNFHRNLETTVEQKKRVWG
jgi:hypothetical protein